MKSLATFKRMVKRLRKQVENAKSILAERESDFYGNPCMLSLFAMDKANEKLADLEQKLENAEEMVNNYSFYASCYEQEENEEMARAMYINM